MTGKPPRVQANRSFALAWSIPVQGAGAPFIDQSHDQHSPKEQHPPISGPANLANTYRPGDQKSRCQVKDDKQHGAQVKLR